MNAKRCVYLFLIFFSIIPFISGEYIEDKNFGDAFGPEVIKGENMVFEDNEFLILNNNELHVLDINFNPLWVWVDEGRILDYKSINDFNSDGYKEILIVSSSFVMPSTKIINGKTGEAIKMFPLIKKTHVNNYPTITSNIAVKNNKIIISNFKRIYEITNNGNSINQKIELPNFEKNLNILDNHLIVATANKIYSYDLNRFNELRTQEITSEIDNQQFFFGDRNFIRLGWIKKGGTQIEIYNSDLSKTGVFSFTGFVNYKYFIFNNEIIVFDESLKKLKIYGVSGNLKTELNEIEAVKKTSDKFYYFSSSKQVFERNPGTGEVLELFNLSDFSYSGKIELLNQDYFVVKEENNLRFYNKGNFTGSYDLDAGIMNIKIDGADFLIKNRWPFEHLYNGLKGKIDLSEMQGKKIVSTEEVADLDNDGTREILIGFSNEDKIETFVLLNTKTNTMNKISFIPTGDELTQIISNLQTQITNLEQTIINKNNAINDLQIQIDDETNPVIKESLIQQREALETEVTNLNNQKNDLQNQLATYQDGGFSYKNKIQSYTLFDNGKRLFITLESEKYIISLLSLEKEKKDIFVNLNFHFLEEIIDINSDSYKDIIFVDDKEIGVFSGNDYSLLWKKNITSDLGINGNVFFDKIGYLTGANFVVIPYLFTESREFVLGKINVNDGVYTEVIREFNLIDLIKTEGLVYRYKEGYTSKIGSDSEDFVFVFLNDGKTIKIKLNFYLGGNPFTKGFSPVVFYDCNNDNKKDVLYAFEEVNTYLKDGRVQNNIINDWSRVTKLICLDIDTNQTLKEFGLPGLVSSGMPMKIINNSLIFKEESFYSVLDLNRFKMIYAILKVPYDSGVGLMNEDGEKIDGINGGIIVSPSENAYIEGDFKLKWRPTNSIVIINTGKYFYTSSFGNEEIIKIKSGNHTVDISYYDSNKKQYFIDSVNVNVKRPKSIITYFVILVSIVIFILGVLKWIKMKR